MVKKKDIDEISKPIANLLKRVHWHTQAGDTKGVFSLVDQIHDLEVERANEMPEPFRTEIIDNLEFQRFALYNAGNGFVEAPLNMAEKLSARLVQMAVIDEDDTDQANNVLQQYFFEMLFGDRILIDSAGKEHSNWRSMCKKSDDSGCCRLVDIKDE